MTQMSNQHMDCYKDRVTYRKDEKVALISLDRPDRMNAFDADMYEGMNQALTRFAEDEDAWVAVIQAEGDRAFSAGADVRALNENAAKGITSGLGELLLDRQMLTSKPLIAAVHGYCVGEGVNLVLSCDVVFAEATAKFMISEVRIGVNPVDIPLKLARKIGYAKAFSFLTPGDARDAQWCRDAGLVEQVCVPGKVREDALLYAKKISQECAPLALRAQKETLWQAVFEDEGKARETGNRLRTLIRQSDDYQEGRDAFMEKRTPLFTGK